MSALSGPLVLHHLWKVPPLVLLGAIGKNVRLDESHVPFLQEDDLGLVRGLAYSLTLQLAQLASHLWPAMGS